LDKAPDAFRTISEVADEIDVPQHVLRFWESRFAQIRPMKRGGGRRYYRPDDVDLLRGVRQLLYGEGYTIRGVQRILRDEGAAFVQNVWRAGAEPPPPPGADDDREGLAERIAEPRSEAELSLFSNVSRAGEAGPTERREPTLVAAGSIKPSAATGELLKGTLRSVLEDLVDCRRLINAALSGNADGVENGRSAEI
jgi:DNA-binding transcriptional MerR regulator